LARVYCPRCGTPNEPGDRFCSACGAGLRKAAATEKRRSPREQLGRLVGTTRKARLISAATAGAIVVAIVGFIALNPSEDAIPRDAYTIEADRICLAAKKQIVAVERSGAANTFAALVPVVGTWRSQFAELVVPADRIGQAQQLETALRDAEVQIARVARIAPHGNKKKTLASAKQADAATTGVEEAVASLGLSECANATIGLSPASS
jgi:uncharacterized Zn finger protein (UPF0148 family)